MTLVAAISVVRSGNRQLLCSCMELEVEAYDKSRADTRVAPATLSLSLFLFASERRSQTDR